MCTISELNRPVLIFQHPVLYYIVIFLLLQYLFYTAFKWFLLCVEGKNCITKAPNFWDTLMYIFQFMIAFKKRLKSKQDQIFWRKSSENILLFTGSFRAGKKRWKRFWRCLCLLNCKWTVLTQKDFLAIFETIVYQFFLWRTLFYIKS